jgi:tetratricopeptide (TPR) repeat protein
LAWEEGDVEKALVSFEAALQKGPLNKTVLDNLWSSTSRLGCFERIVPVLEAAIRRKPDLWLGHEYLAFAHSENSNLESAIVKEKKALELAPKRPHGYTNLAYFYDILGCLEQAAEYYHEALQLERRSGFYTNLAAASFYSGHYAEALQAAQEALVYLEEEKELSFVESGNLGDIYFWAPNGNRETAANFYKEALRLVNQSIDENPGDVRDLRSKCWYLAMLDETNSARQCLESVLALDHLNSDTCYKVALVYQKLNQDEKALQFLERSLEQGMLAHRVRHEPIFRENPAVEDLLRPYLEIPISCP